MAKKTTRQRKALAQQRAVQQAVANVSMVTSRPSAPMPAPSTPKLAQPAHDFSAEYARVRTDLRRIAILAISIVAILVALSFVIR
ncbi:MAG TPA: hypothetical protein VIK33_04515 [Anaerolineae bacterium]